MRARDHILIFALICREFFRRFSKRLRSGPLVRWKFSGGTVGELTLAPQDLRPADPELAIAIYSGQFSFGHDNVNTGGDSPFLAASPSAEWFAHLHGFRWLRHLGQADTHLAKSNAAALVSDWIDYWGSQINSDAWHVETVSSRLISWFCHAPLLISDSSPETYNTILKSMGRQSRFLHHNAPHLYEGYPRLHAAIALAYASLCLSVREKYVRQAARELDRELEKQILPDGGHVSRNPSVLIEILADLLPLKRMYVKVGQIPPAALQSAIDRMMGALRFMRHSNGSLAQFNGTGFTDQALLTTVLRYDETQAALTDSATHWGYERLSAGKTVVLVDCGKPFSRSTARRAMAGTLSFELSFGGTRFVGNCGAPESRYNQYAPFARATAAHSTVTINDHSSSLFARETRLNNLLPSPLIRGPGTVTCQRDNFEGFKRLVASHDGYRDQSGFIHHRELHLSHDGNTLNGTETFEKVLKLGKGNSFAALRFHLPNAISASMLSSGHSVLIAAPNKHAWAFTCVDGRVTLEESIQFSGPGHPRKSEQIVVYVDPEAQDNVRWTFERRTGRSPERAQPGTQGAQTDLLEGLDQATAAADSLDVS